MSWEKGERNGGHSPCKLGREEEDHHFPTTAPTVAAAHSTPSEAFPSAGGNKNERATHERGEGRGGLLAAQKVVAASSFGGGNSLEVILRSHRGEEAAKGGRKQQLSFLWIRPFPAADRRTTTLRLRSCTQRGNWRRGGVKWREGGKGTLPTQGGNRWNTRNERISYCTFPSVKDTKST